MSLRLARSILQTLGVGFFFCSANVLGQTVIRLDPGDYILIKRHSFSLPQDDEEKKNGESEFFKNITEQARKQSKLESNRASSPSVEASGVAGLNGWTIRSIDRGNSSPLPSVEIGDK